ncbi:MAG: Gfo/Idh/MocA family oxidoreductase [Verrucomicrobiales bacterium]|jgi:predicted dehydrogenase|nr:Gfo/Idh/MocA family oxidoreductase [Verrucomicrobiales bacterium]
MMKGNSAARLSRRGFLTTTAGALLACGMPAWVRAQGVAPKGNKLRMACIGVGGQGLNNVRNVAGEEIVALCDVDFIRGGGAFHQFPNAVRYRDYRQMFDEMADQIDAVVVSTPDHTHFPAAMRALEAGKPIYVEKPLTRTIGEARLLKEAARKAGVVTQMGNQGHTNEGTRLVKEWIDAGAIGTVTEVHAWTNRPSWPQGIDLPAIEKPPLTLDWNLWLGTAPWDDYRRNVLPFNWRGYWNYGSGALGDMGCHLLDAPFWVMDLRGSVKISAESEGGNKVAAPKWSIINFEYPARGGCPPLKMTWYDGGKKPPRPPELEAEKELPGGGTIYRGDRGVILVTGDYSDSPRLIPETAMKEFKRPEKTIPRVHGGPHKEWINAIKGNGPAPGSNIVEHSADLTEFVLLGNLAIIAGQPIEWDAEKLEVKGMPELNSFIHPSHRIF